MDAGEIDPPTDAAACLFLYVKDDKVSQERLVTELAAIGFMDMKITDEERAYINSFQGFFDMKPSEFNALCEHGSSWAIALNYFGDEYMRAKTSS